MFKRNLEINGVMQTIITHLDAKLSEVLRNQLLLTGTKVGCGIENVELVMFFRWQVVRSLYHQNEKHQRLFQDCYH